MCGGWVFENLQRGAPYKRSIRARASGGSVSGMVLVALTSAALVFALYRANLVSTLRQH